MSSKYSATLNKIKKLYKNSDKKLISEAFEFALNAHGEQKRSSGEEYITHPLDAALTLSQMNVDAKTIAAALLHDVVDDTDITLSEIEKKFGKEITFLVDGVSKLGKIKYRGIERHAENLRKMLVAMAKDFRVLLIKLGDRYHNLKTLDALPPAKRKRVALESLEIYAPLAFRCGISELAKKIEDSSFKYCYPQEYNSVLAKVRREYPEREAYLEKIKPRVKKELGKENIYPLKIQTRAKHYWSLYKKLKKYNMNWENIYDLVAMRIIVRNIEECYATLGVIHKLYKPLPGQIKDYIALPKPNGYQSVHTTVFCESGVITEFQIRTREMHESAENGIAAHWLYSESDKPTDGAKAESKRFGWVSQLRQWQEHSSESSEFLESLKIDVFSDRIFVFTPLGDVVDLPEKATPVDFAYAIHSTLGNTCSQVKINGEMGSLDTELKNGDMVEIIKAPKKGPSRDWLRFVKTNIAKSRIKAYLKNARKKENIQQGESLLNAELEKFGQKRWSAVLKKQKEKSLQNLPYKNEPALLAAVGEGDISPYRVIKYVLNKEQILANQKIPSASSMGSGTKNGPLVRIAGQEGISSRIALCCSPIPDEDIRAYVTRAGGTAIHGTSCANLRRLILRNQNRILPASWKEGKNKNFVNLKIIGTDRLGLMQEISSTISNMGINMTHLSAERTDDNAAKISINVEVFDIDQLYHLIRLVEGVGGVREVKRV